MPEMLNNRYQAQLLTCKLHIRDETDDNSNRH